MIDNFARSLANGAAASVSGLITPRLFRAKGVNLNVVGDTQISISLPSGITRYAVTGVYVLNGSTSLTTATLGLFTAASGGGVSIVAASALAGITVSTGDTNADMLSLTITDSLTRFLTDLTLFAHVAVAQGAAATADVVVQILPLS